MNAKELQQHASNALNKFKKDHPNVTSGDLQTFALGYKACENIMVEHQKVVQQKVEGLLNKINKELEE